MKVISFINEFESVPYKLVNYVDNTYFGPHGSADLHLMVFQNGKIIGTSKYETYAPDGSEIVLLDDSLVMGSVNKRLVGPMIKHDTRGGSLGKIYTTKMKYNVDDKIAEGKGMWYYNIPAQKLERAIKQIQNSSESNAFFEKIDGEQLLGFDGEAKELVEEIKDKADSFQKSLRMYKRY